MHRERPKDVSHVACVADLVLFDDDRLYRRSSSSPNRTQAEEYGLVGSTEFGEDYAKWTKNIVAYLNVDVCKCYKTARSGKGHSCQQHR